MKKKTPDINDEKENNLMESVKRNQSWVLVAKDDPSCGGSVDDQPTLITKMTIKKKKTVDHKDDHKEKES